jgi:hypothetical protein
LKSNTIGLLHRKIRKIDSKISILNLRSQRYSWYRLIVIIAGILFTWYAAYHFDAIWGWSIFTISISAFIFVVYLHNQLDKTIQRLIIWKEINQNNLARIQLDWQKIPNPIHPNNSSVSGIAIDLDLIGPKSLHQLIDTSISLEGSLLLAEWLTQNSPKLNEIQSRQSIIFELAKMQRFRDRLLLHFRIISSDAMRGEKFIQWLNTEGSFVNNTKLAISFSLTSITILLFIASNLTILPAIWIFTLSIYAFYYFINLKTLNTTLLPFTEIESELDKFRAVLKFIETYPMKTSPNLNKLCKVFRNEIAPPSIQLRQVKLITAAVGVRMNPIFGFLINLIIPWDFSIAYFAQKKRKKLENLLPHWLSNFNKLEALSALGNFSALNPEYQFPTISNDINPIFQTQQIGHPLLPSESRICNDFSIEHNGSTAIITGSNMTGKSTFIKTIGINLCLAYAGAPVCARNFNSIPLHLHTCIRIKDSLTDGYSYFYAEVRCLKQLMTRLYEEQEIPTLFLIDEIFRGTNNRERLIGSRSFIKSSLGTRGVGLIATHDLELATLTQESNFVRNYHFQDSVQDGQLVFDFKIHNGPSKTTNALKILEMEGLPTDT